jgi:hypothetical protein
MFLVSDRVNRFSILGLDFSVEGVEMENIDPKLIGDDTNSKKLRQFAHF